MEILSMSTHLSSDFPFLLHIFLDSIQYFVCIPRSDSQFFFSYRIFSHGLSPIYHTIDSRNSLNANQIQTY